MGLQCTTCGAPVADDAQRCPACGATLAKKTKLLPIAAFMLIVILVIHSYMNKAEQESAAPAPPAQAQQQP